MINFFENLPVEIRCEIFRYTFESSTNLISLSRTSYHQSPIRYRILTLEGDHCGTIHLGILRTCKQFYVDCQDLLWKYNTLDVEALWHESGRGVNAAALWHESGRTRIFDKAITNKVRSIQMDYNDEGMDLALEGRLRTFATWQSLQSMTVVLRDKFSRDPSTWSHRQLKRWLQYRTDQIYYPKLLLILAQAGGDGGFLQHVQRRILLDTGTPSFTEDAFPSRYFMKPDEGDPSTLLAEINRAFGGTLWVNGVSSFENGECINPVFLGKDIVVYKSDLEICTLVSIVTSVLGWNRHDCTKAILAGNEFYKNSVFDRHPTLDFVRSGDSGHRGFLMYLESRYKTGPDSKCPAIL